MEKEGQDAHGRVRRYYGLTGVGEAALAEETERLAANVRAARRGLSRLGVRPAVGST